MNRKKIKEIDSLDFIIVFWKNKIKVMMITLLFITFSIILANHQKDKSFKIIAKIDQISAFDETKYVLYNALIADFKSLLPITQNYEKEENNLNIISKETYKFPFNNNESILFKIDKVFEEIDYFIEKNENKISFNTNLNVKNTKFKIDNINYKKKDKIFNHFKINFVFPLKLIILPFSIISKPLESIEVLFEINLDLFLLEATKVFLLNMT